MKKYFVAGLIILLPITLTVILFLFVIDLFTEPFLDYARELLLHFPQSRFLVSSPELLSTISRLIILCLLAAFILVLGVIARWFFFQNLVNWTQKTFLKIPFVKTIYKILKEVMQAFFSQEGEKVFKCPALVPFPSKKSHCIGFITGKVPPIFEEKVSKSLTAVFVPTAPHPISGYLILVPEDEIKKINMSNEDAVKFTVSCGVILPEDTKVES